MIPTASAQDVLHRLNFDWLIKLRWGALAGQLVTILVARFGLDVHLELIPLLTIIVFAVVTNIAAVRWASSSGEIPQSLVGAVIGLDIVLLTGLLHFSGGPFNPFSFLYLVQIALAAVMLRPAWTWALVALSVLGSGTLFVGYDPNAAHDMRLHLEGMWVAFAVSAAFIVYFVGRVSSSLRKREEELHTTHTLASLATLAAGAAHELSTPLSTIAVIAKELERKLEDADNLEDARLIRSQVDRCRDILEQMAADAGQTIGESLVELTAADIVAACADPARGEVVVEMSTRVADSRLSVYPRAVGQAMRNVINNAIDASSNDRATLTVSRAGSSVRFDVSDDGPGMSEDVRARAFEPFFTTKQAGQGMGLGLFLARAIIDRNTGRIDIDSATGRGTTVSVTLPTRD